MTAVQFMKYLVLIAGIGALIKGLIIVLWPARFKRLVHWWLGLPPKLLRTLGALMVVIGVICVAVAAVHSGNWLIAATIMLGTFFVLGGFLYQVPGAMRQAAPALLGNAVLARIWGVLALIIACALLLIALR